MTDKAKPPARPASQPKTARPSPPAATNPLRQPDLRWQRSVRYGWDKGGSRGGR
ncbi:MAG: hypothetical protein WAZ34_01580 [Rhodocyclaceae bacterium]